MDVLTKEIKIVIADDHLLIRKAMGLLIAQNNVYKVIGEASNGNELLLLLENSLPDIVLLDVYMPEMNGIDAAIQVKEKFPSVKIIVLSVQTEQAYIRKLFSIGVSGFITKNSPKEELFKALKDVSEGKEYLSKDIIQLTSQQAGNTSRKKLSKREVEIIKLIKDGLTNKQIAERIFVSLKTVESHRTNVFRKLQVKNVAELLKHVNDNMLLN